MTQAKHTPLPWVISGVGKQRTIFHATGDRAFDVATLEHDARYGAGDVGENAAFIVRACNSHYELLEALIQLYEHSAHITDIPGNTKSKAQQAILKAKAEGGAA